VQNYRPLLEKKRSISKWFPFHMSTGDWGFINWIQSACRYHRYHLYAMLDSFNLRTRTCFVPCVIALLELLGFRFVFGSHPSLFHGRFCLLLFYSSVANFQQYQPAPIESTPTGLQVPRFPGFSKVQTCLRFNIARVIHLKQFRLGMLQWEFVWSCMFRISFMKTGVYHSDRPFFANINA